MGNKITYGTEAIRMQGIQIQKLARLDLQHPNEEVVIKLPPNDDVTFTIPQKENENILDKDFQGTEALTSQNIDITKVKLVICELNKFIKQSGYEECAKDFQGLIQQERFSVVFSFCLLGVPYFCWKFGLKGTFKKYIQTRADLLRTVQEYLIMTNAAFLQEFGFVVIVTEDFPAYIQIKSTLGVQREAIKLYETPKSKKSSRNPSFSGKKVMMIEAQMPNKI